MTYPTKVKVYRKSRKKLECYPDGLMVISPSKPAQKIDRGYYGESFLLRYGAWGFINLSQEPDYFGLYVSSPISAVMYFGVVEEIIDPKKEEFTIDDSWKDESYDEGNKLIILKRDMIVELDDPLPYGGTRIQRFRYTTLNKFIDAETTDDLWG